ncbi:methyltransferase domain-containing protein [Herbidospora cretacea]|uniref:methyltransferase domain-containing protein n=1 Tax=Herbidospora cretacea TaxID=28444 RepID=UPI0005500EF3|nr:methyltransferase domain-containing protein [Herbidospora cretacea]
MSNTEVIALLDAIERHPDAIRVRRRTYEPLERAESVVDVGCGGGRAVHELGARAVGVDHDPATIAVARARYPGARFHVADAHTLPFPDGSLDGYRAERVLHTLDAPRALAEARRVLRPGGRLVVAGHDWDLLAVDSDLPEVTRRVVHTRADQLPHPRAARKAHHLLREAGFTDVATEVLGTVITGPEGLRAVVNLAKGQEGEEITAWLDDQRRKAAEGRLFLAVPVFVTTAQVIA